MGKITLCIKGTAGAVAGIAAAIFGPLNTLFYGLLFCVVADYVTGICAAIYQRKLDSRAGFDGILKKAVLMMVVALAHVVGNVTGIVQIRDIVIGFYIANEGLSILENAAKMDIKYTEKLKKWLSQLKEIQ